MGPEETATVLAELEAAVVQRLVTVDAIKGHLPALRRLEKKGRTEESIRKTEEAAKMIHKLAEEHGVRVKVYPDRSVPKPAKPKYRHPKDESRTWTGRGKSPVWFRDLVSGGVSPESMLIRDPNSDQQS